MEATGSLARMARQTASSRRRWLVGACFHLFPSPPFIFYLFYRQPYCIKLHFIFPGSLQQHSVLTSSNILHKSSAACSGVCVHDVAPEVPATVDRCAHYSAHTSHAEIGGVDVLGAALLQCTGSGHAALITSLWVFREE